MATYRSAQGKSVDMAALAAKNERVRAVGNMKVNARGDTIDDNGKIIIPVTQKVGEKYQRTVGNRSAQARRAAPVQPPQQVQEELTEAEKELTADVEHDDEIEQIKAKENNKR